MTSLDTLPALPGYFAGSPVLLAIFLWLTEKPLPGQERALARPGSPAAALNVGWATIMVAGPLILGVLDAACPN